MEIETVVLTTTDGVELVGDRIGPPDAPLGAVVAHPHPLYGGDRHSPVVTAIWESLGAVGVRALRVDFRGAGASTGRHDHGQGERADLAAAAGMLYEEHPRRRLWFVGYSFGALVASRCDHLAVAGWALIAPPLGFPTDPASEPAEVPAAGRDDRPTLVVSARHDQFASPETTAEVLRTWKGVDQVILESADHFLHGSLRSVADLVTGHVADPRG